MNKFITIYELLELVKDGKAPKKIKYENIIWKYNLEENEYIEDRKDYRRFQDYFSINLNFLDCLKDKVEILEENKPIIEKLKIKDNKVIGKWGNGSDYRYTLSAPQVVIINKLNEVIDYINKKEEK